MIGRRVSRADRSSVVEGLVMASVRAEAGRGSLLGVEGGVGVMRRDDRARACFCLSNRGRFP
ncbi:MAG: hypothetical protein JWP03_2275 [Phycisphaerales bacterium]|nr:hypothetical protein [Phycisphaerales bacterium]